MSHKPASKPKSAPKPKSKPNLETFLSTFSPMEAGKARKALMRPWKLGDMGLRPLHEHIESVLEKGGRVGSVSTGAFIALVNGNTFDKLPQTASKYAEHIRHDIEAWRRQAETGRDPRLDAYLVAGASDPEHIGRDETYNILSLAPDRAELERLSWYIAQQFPSLEVALRESMESVIEEKGWGVTASSKPTSKPRSSKPKSPKAEPAWARRWGGYTQADEDAANRYTHFPRNLADMNEGLRASMVEQEGEIRKRLARWKVIADLDAPLPEDIDRALHRYHGALMHRQRENSRAKMIAPPWTVTGRSGYKGRPDKANAVESNAQEVLDKALRRLSKVVGGYDLNRPVMAGEADAVERLNEKLEALQESHEIMVRANKILRGKEDADEKLADLMALGLPESQARKLFEPDFAGRTGFAAYQISGSTAEMTRIKERIASLTQAKSLETVSFPFDGGEVVEDTTQMRLQINHDRKPPKDVLDKLKAAGFHWSRQQGVWQRTLTEEARRAARAIVGEYDAGQPERPLHAAPAEKSKAEQLAEQKRDAGRKAILDYVTAEPEFELASMTSEQAAEMLRRMFRAQGYRERKTDDTFIASDREFRFDPAANKLHVTVQAKVYGKVVSSQSADRDLVAEARKIAEKVLATFSKPVSAKPESKPPSQKPTSKPRSSKKPTSAEPTRIDGISVQRGDVIDISFSQAIPMPTPQVFGLVTNNERFSKKLTEIQYLASDAHGHFDPEGKVLRKRIGLDWWVTVVRRGVKFPGEEAEAPRSRPASRPRSAPKPSSHPKSPRKPSSARKRPTVGRNEIMVFRSGMRIFPVQREGSEPVMIPVMGKDSWVAFVARSSLLPHVETLADLTAEGRGQPEITVSRGHAKASPEVIIGNGHPMWEKISADVVAPEDAPTYTVTGTIVPEEWVRVASGSRQPILRIEVERSGNAELYDDVIDWGEGPPPPTAPSLPIFSPHSLTHIWNIGLESKAWLDRQNADREALTNPRGFWANVAAYNALLQTKAEFGPAAAEMYVWDILPDAGFIDGDEGRVYTVLPDGNIVLNASTASPEKRAIAAQIMLVG